MVWLINILQNKFKVKTTLILCEEKHFSRSKYRLFAATFAARKINVELKQQHETLILRKTYATVDKKITK